MIDPRLSILAEEYRRQREALLASFPELAEDAETLSDTLDGITDAGDVIARFIRLAREDEMMVVGLGVMLKDMQERKARLDRRRERYRDAALALMQAIGERKIERPDFTASVRTVPPTAVIAEPDAIPDRYCAIKRAPKMAEITAALRNGETVIGATLGNGGASLTVRTK